MFDVEALSHLCKILYTYDIALDIAALHVRISDLVFHALSLLDEYDCESVGSSFLWQINFEIYILYQVTRKQLSVTSGTLYYLPSVLLRDSTSVCPHRCSLSS